MNIHVNSFVKRQTKDSRFAHTTIRWEDLAEFVHRQMKGIATMRKGYRAGVNLVSFLDEGGWFFTSVCSLKTGDLLEGRFESRREGETPRKTTYVKSQSKVPAKRVDIVLYASTVLAEDGDNELPAEDGNWEIVSINAYPDDVEAPIEPTVLMHNHFGSDGGTVTGLSDSEFVVMLRESFEYWKDKAHCG